MLLNGTLKLPRFSPSSLPGAQHEWSPNSSANKQLIESCRQSPPKLKSREHQGKDHLWILRSTERAEQTPCFNDTDTFPAPGRVHPCIPTRAGRPADSSVLPYARASPGKAPMLQALQAASFCAEPWHISRLGLQGIICRWNVNEHYCWYPGRLR